MCGLDLQTNGVTLLPLAVDIIPFIFTRPPSQGHRVVFNGGAYTGAAPSTLQGVQLGEILRNFI